MEATPDWGCFDNNLGGVEGWVSQIFRLYCQAGQTPCSLRREYFNIAESRSCGTLRGEITKSNSLLQKALQSVTLKCSR